jgi:two-component system, LuxR family, response regulator FixJ
MPARARVLVVDDDLACRVLAALLLESAGHIPTAVGSVDRALDRLSGDRPDVVVTDLMMPGQSGLDLMLRLRERGDAVPVVVVTGSQDPELVARAFELGAVSVLAKPYASDALAAAVDAALLPARREAA